MTTANKFERFELRVIHRSQIYVADYNPRKIADENRKNLKKFMKEEGLLTVSFIWNEETSTLVQGHRRLETLDALMGTLDYNLTVAVVNMELEREIKANVKLNNPGLQGEWDYEVLRNIQDMGNFNVNLDFGFNKEEIDLIWGISEPVDFLYNTIHTDMAQNNDWTATISMSDHNKPAITPEQQQAFRDIKAAGREKAKRDNADGHGYSMSKADYFFTVVCNTSEQKQAFMQLLGASPTEQLVSYESLLAFINNKK